VGRTCRGPVLLTLGLGAGLLAVGVAASERTGTHSTAVRIRDAETARAVNEALREASGALGRPECREVLSDFRDATGRPLAATLASIGAGAQEFLSALLFYDGSGHPACVKKGALAFTQPSSRVVFICGPAFLKAHPLHAKATVIHEMLHALGLAYEAPGRNGTNEAVLRRCRE
jgi:hypothetical protein